MNACENKVKLEQCFEQFSFKNCKEISDLLIDHFGSLERIAKADLKQYPPELMEKHEVYVLVQLASLIAQHLSYGEASANIRIH